MIEDMTVREISEKTQSHYIRHIKNFTMFLGGSPDARRRQRIVRRFQVHQRETGITPPTMNGAVAALRLLLQDNARPARGGAPSHASCAEPRRLPNVLAPDEVLRLLEAAPGPKYKAAFGLAADGGVSDEEIAMSLKVSDIDSQRTSAAS